MALSSIAPASWSAPALWRFSGVSRPSQSSTGVEHSRTLTRRLLAAFVILHSAFVIAAEPTPPTRTELWLPSSKLDSFLKKNPKAVLLTPEQYKALIRDAGKTEPKVDPALEAPKSLVIEHLDLKGTVEPGATSIMLRGVLTVNVPADGWASGSLAWPYYFDISQTEPPREGPLLAWITQDEFKADKLPAETMRSLSLAVRGPGRRTLHFKGTLPLYYRLRSGERSLDLQHIGCGGRVTLTLPEGAELLPGSAATRQGNTVTAAFDHRFIRRSDNGDPLTSIPADKKTAGATLPDAVRIRWTDPQHESDIEPLRLIDTGGSMHFGVSDSRLETRLHFAAHVRRGQKGQHETAWPILGGADTQVTAVSGPDVLAWRQNGETLHVTLSQSTAAAPIDIALSRPLVLTAASTLVLPSLKLPLTLAADLHTTEGVDLLALEGLRGNSLRLDAAAPQITLRPATARLEADVDVAAKLDRDSLRIERTLNLRSDRPVSSVKLVLPEGEEFIAVLRQDQGSISNVSQIAVSNISVSPNIISAPVFADFTWRRVGSAITLLFAKPFTSTGEKIIITSRQKLLKAWSGPKTPETLTLGHLSIPEAVKVAGYTALDFDDSWRVSLKSANGLEDRDARLTPVKGRMAWFGLREHALTVEVERAEAVFSAEVTAYALPRARSIEIEGQFTLDISGAPLRRFQVKLPPVTAKLLRVTSPLIGEQQLDEATGIWTLTLRQESKGRQNIRWRMSLAAEAGADSLTTTATLPRIEIPSSRRFTGTWIIEANTDTQLSTQAQGMQPLDVLKAPAVADYAPRHRVTSAFSFGVAEHALTLTAQRHAHSELAPLVITHLRLTSVLDAHGTALHEAHAELLHTGEQFIALALPPGAVLLSTLANGDAVKPVRSSGDAIAIPLPAGSANTPTTITLQYRLQTTPWQPSGTQDLPPVQLAPNVPVLATTWLLHTPKTFSITEPETTLELLDAKEVPNVVVAALQSLGGPWAYISGKSDKRADDVLFSMSASGALDIDPVEAVERGLLLASSSSELGNYDQGIAHYQDVLRIDPHNSAARRGMENAERKRMEYFKSAYDQQRAKMLTQVDEMWEDKVPTNVNASATSSTRSQSAYLISKMDQIMFPSVQFQNVTVGQVVEFLRLKSRELDSIETDPSRKGVNIILRTGDAPANASINLDLKNVPMSEALRYVCDLAQMRFKVEAYGVVVVPLSDNNTEMVTRTFKVTPDFLAKATAMSASSAADPFAPAGVSKDVSKRTLKDILQIHGITFPEGATATYSAERGTVEIRNSNPNNDLAAGFIEHITGVPQSVSGNVSSLALTASPAPGGQLNVMDVADPFAAKPARAGLFANVDEITSFQTKSGLIPLAVEMPSEGRLLRFAGHQAPPVLHLRYVSWERQMLVAVLAMLGGMVAFALVAWRRRPWIATLLVIILAALAFPLLLEGDALALANAAAFGWVTMFVVRVLAGVMAWGMERGAWREDSVSGEGVAA